MFTPKKKLSKNHELFFQMHIRYLSIVKSLICKNDQLSRTLNYLSVIFFPCRNSHLLYVQYIGWTCFIRGTYLFAKCRWNLYSNLHTYAYVYLNMKALKQGSVKIIFLGNNPSTCIILYHTGWVRLFKPFNFVPFN